MGCPCACGLLGEPCHDLAQRQPRAFGAKCHGSGDQCRIAFHVRPPATATLARVPLLAVARRLELGNKRRLFELRDGTEHLTHKHRGRRILDKEIRRRRRDHGDAELAQAVMAGELHSQVTGESVRALDNDGSHPIAGDSVQHRNEALALGYRVGAGHRGVVEFGNGGFGEIDRDCGLGNLADQSFPARSTRRRMLPFARSSFLMSVAKSQIMHNAAGTIMSYVITGTNSAGVLSLKRDSAVAAIKKAVELMGDGTRDVHITDPDGRIYSDAEFSQLYMAART